MSEGYFKSSIRRIMLRRMPQPDVSLHTIRDFMDAVLEIDNPAEATWFYEGSVEWDCSIYKDLALTTIQSDTKSFILQIIENGISDPVLRSSRRTMWWKLFGTLEDLIPYKEVV